MIKHRLNTLKHRLYVEKDKSDACRKNQEKKPCCFFLANFFRGLSFYGADYHRLQPPYTFITYGFTPLILRASPLLIPWQDFHSSSYCMARLSLLFLSYGSAFTQLLSPAKHPFSFLLSFSHVTHIFR